MILNMLLPDKYTEILVGRGEGGGEFSICRKF